MQSMMVKRHLDLYAEPGSGGKLFASWTGGYLSQSTLNGKPKRIRLIKGRIVNESATAFRKACDVAGRPDLRLHDLRHTGAVLAAATGATLAELQARLGHSTVTAAMRYQHAASDRDAAISEALSKMVRG
jgi:integrase